MPHAQVVMAPVKKMVPKVHHAMHVKVKVSRKILYSEKRPNVILVMVKDTSLKILVILVMEKV